MERGRTRADASAPVLSSLQDSLHEYYPGMNASKIAISIEPSLLKQIDSLVSRKLFRSRSEIFQIAVIKQIELLDEDAFDRECAKLDPVEEQLFADIGISTNLNEWPAY